MNRFIAIQSGFFNCYSMSFLYIKKMSVLFIFVVSLLSMASAQSKTDSLEQLLPEKEGLERLDVLFNLSKEYIYSNSSKSMEYAIEAYNIAKATNDDSLSAKASKILGHSYFIIFDYDKAVEYTLESANLAEKNDNMILLARCYNLLGAINSDAKNNDKAIEYFSSALDVFTEMNDVEGIASSKNNIGIIYSLKQDYEKALICFLESIELGKSLNNSDKFSSYLGNCGITAMSLKRYTEAKSYFQEAYKIAKQTNNTFSEMVYLINLSKVNIYLSNLEKAKSHFQEALEYSYTFEIANPKLYQSLSELFELTGDYKGALEYHKKYLNAELEINNNETKKQIANLQIKYETEKKVQKITILESNALIQSLELDKQTNYRNMAMLSSVFILFVAILIFMGYRQKSKSNKLLNTLNDKLKQSYKKLSTQAADLQISKDKLQAVNNDLEAFSYSVSHDLRAPLRAIGGFMEVIIEDYEDKLDSEAHRLMKIIIESTRNMNQLITDLLDFSHIGNEQLETSEIDMKNLAEEVFDELKKIHPKLDIKLELTEIPSTSGDYNLIRQVYTNLISNAIKFSGNEKVPEIKIGSLEKGNQLFYYVKDNGVGFDMKYVDEIFGVFQRLHSPNEFEGTGVGLAIVQKIIQKHGGEVMAEGEEGKGATIYFSLPIIEHS